jgi:flagellin
MSYLLTNASAMTALQSLTMTQNALSQTQSELSTGLAIQNASDNASYWSIAQTMSSDNSVLGAASSSLGISASQLSTTNSAITQAISVVNNIKTDLYNAQSAGPTQLAQIGSDIVAQQNALVGIANAAAFNGTNWLNGTVGGTTSSAATTTVNLVAGLNNSKGNADTVAYISVAANNVNLFTNGASSATTASGGILASTSGTVSWQVLGATGTTSGGAITLGTGTAQTDIANMYNSVNSVLSSLETAAQTIGGAQEQVTIQQSFLSTMQTNLSNGVASLVDANMNQVSTRLQALQTQQQLGVQSLSIANQSSQMILKLFQ